MLFWRAKWSCHQISIYSKWVDVKFGRSKKGGNVFQCIKLEELMMREDFKLAATCSKSAGTNLTIKKWNSNKNFRIKKVCNCNMRGILWNSDRISQPRCWIVKAHRVPHNSYQGATGNVSCNPASNQQAIPLVHWHPWLCWECIQPEHNEVNKFHL